MKKMTLAVLALSLTLVFAGAFADAPKPKYGPAGAPRAIPLHTDNDYFRKNKAVDFWNLIGYYAPQKHGCSCGSASIALAINALKAKLPKTADDTNFKEENLETGIKTSLRNFKDRMTCKGVEKGMPNIIQQTDVVKEALTVAKLVDYQPQSVEIKNQDSSTKTTFINNLTKNEESPDNLILINFNQKSATDDAEVGHIAVIGAYDASKKRVLVLDPDRDYYEPYWVSVDHLLEGMNTLDSSKQFNRGYIVIEKVK